MFLVQKNLKIYLSKYILKLLSSQSTALPCWNVCIQIGSCHCLFELVCSVWDDTQGKQHKSLSLWHNIISGHSTALKHTCSLSSVSVKRMSWFRRIIFSETFLVSLPAIRSSTVWKRTGCWSQLLPPWRWLSAPCRSNLSTEAQRTRQICERVKAWALG